MPPRAADTNDPVSLFGRALPAVGGSNGAGACGSVAACDVSAASSELNAYTPAAPRLAPAPIRSTARRVRSGMIAMMPPVAGITRRATPYWKHCVIWRDLSVTMR